MSKEMRLGAIIKTIANHPGITMSGLLTELTSQGLTLSERTLAKDIAQLKTEFELLPQQERLRQGYFLDTVCSLSQEEVGLVLDALHVFGLQLGAPEATALSKRLYRWMKETSDTQPRTRSIRQRNIYKKGEGSKQSEELLLQAIRKHQAVVLIHQPPVGRKSETVKGYPLLMVFHERGWYCIVRDLKIDSYRPFRIDRIKSCSLDGGAPDNPKYATDLAECEFLLSCGWGMGFPANRTELKLANEAPPIVVRFDGTVAPFILEAVERHPFGKIKAARDGTGDAYFEIHLSNPREFLFWVRSFGSHAWIVSPAALADAERAEVRRMASRYS